MNQTNSRNDQKGALLIKRHGYFTNWIEKQLQKRRPKPANFFTTFGRLSRIMNAIEDDKDLLVNYEDEEIRVARSLMHMTNTMFLDEIATLETHTVELSGDGIQVLRWFKERDLNDQGNLVSNLGFLTDIVHDHKQEQTSAWDQQTVKIAKMAEQLNNDELITALLKVQAKQQVPEWKASYAPKNKTTDFDI